MPLNAGELDGDFLAESSITAVEYQEKALALIEDARALHESSMDSFHSIDPENISRDELKELQREQRINFLRASEHIWNAAVAADSVAVASGEDDQIILSTQKSIFRFYRQMTYEYVVTIKPGMLFFLDNSEDSSPVAEPEIAKEPARESAPDSAPAPEIDEMPEPEPASITDEIPEPEPAVVTDETPESEPVPAETPEPDPATTVTEPAPPPTPSPCRIAETEYNEARQAEEETCADTVQVVKGSDCHNAMTATKGAYNNFREICILGGNGR